MANYSRDPAATLAANERKHYVGLHLEQGVPLLDRDLNLMQDLLATAIRRALREFIGDGAPQPGDDCFRVVPVGYAPWDDPPDAGSSGDEPPTGEPSDPGSPGEGSGDRPSGGDPAGDGPPERDTPRPRGGGPVGADNDFEILRGGGRFLADGLLLVNDHRIRYSDQPGVPALAAPRQGDRYDVVYLDVWTEEVGAAEDPDLRNDDDVGVQTAVRQCHRWLVRVAEGADYPPPADAGHAHVTLANLRRTAGKAAIDDAGDVIDLRRHGLNLDSVLRTMLTGFAPRFTAPGTQLRPTIGVAGTRLTLTGRNLDLAGMAQLLPTTGGPDAGHAGVEVGGRPGEVVVTVPDGACGDCVVEVSGDYGSARTWDRFTVLRATVLPVPDDAQDAAARAVNTSTRVAGSCTLAGRSAALYWDRVDGQWQVSVLPELDPGAVEGAEATGLDDAGHVIGHSGGQAVVWLAGSADGPTVLAASGLDLPSADAISPDGRVIAGHGALGMDQPQVAIVWRQDYGPWSYAGTLPLGANDPTGTLSAVHAAANGLLAGAISGMDGSSRAVIWQPAGDSWYLREVFPDPDKRPPGSVATAVNDTGVVAGTYQRDGEPWLFLWDSATGQLLTTEPGPAPCGLSQDNRVLANLPWPEAASGPPNWPVLWDQRSGQVLLVRPWDYAEAFALNARGEVAGRRLLDIPAQALVWTAS